MRWLNGCHRLQRPRRRPSGPPLSHHVHGAAWGKARQPIRRTTWSIGGRTDDFQRRRKQPRVVRTKAPVQMPTRLTRRYYLAEVKLRVAENDFSWISRSLNAACLRVRSNNRRPEVLSAAYIPDDGRLSCIVKAEGVEDIHRLFGDALLPSARVVDAIVVTLGTPRRPGGPSSAPTHARPSGQPPLSS